MFKPNKEDEEKLLEILKLNEDKKLNKEQALFKFIRYLIKNQRLVQGDNFPDEYLNCKFDINDIDTVRRALIEKEIFSVARILKINSYNEYLKKDDKFNDLYRKCIESINIISSKNKPDIKKRIEELKEDKKIQKFFKVCDEEDIISEFDKMIDNLKLDRAEER